MEVMFPSLFSNKAKPAAHVIIDVGSSALKAVIFEILGGSPLPQVLKKIIIRPVKDAALREPGRVIMRLRELVFGMVRELGRVPERILIAFGPHMVEQTLASWRIKPMAWKRGGAIVRRDLRTYFENAFLERRNAERAEVAYPIAVLMNGYPVTTSLFQGSGRIENLASIQEITFHTLILSFPNEIGPALAEMKKSLGGMPIEFIPLAAAVHFAFLKKLSLRDVFGVDVGGEETNIMVIRGGTLTANSSFPLGANHFIRGIAGALGISFEEAMNIKRKYLERMPGDAMAKLNNFLAEESHLWKLMFLEELERWYHLGPLPEELILFGGGAALSEIGGALRDGDWFKNYSHADMPRLRLLPGNAIFEGNSLEGFLQGPEDVGIASLMVYSMEHVPLF